jgi:hypothetical protein
MQFLLKRGKLSARHPSRRNRMRWRMNLEQQVSTKLTLHTFRRTQTRQEEGWAAWRNRQSVLSNPSIKIWRNEVLQNVRRCHMEKRLPMSNTADIEIDGLLRSSTSVSFGLNWVMISKTTGTRRGAALTENSPPGSFWRFPYFCWKEARSFQKKKNTTFPVFLLSRFTKI